MPKSRTLMTTESQNHEPIEVGHTRAGRRIEYLSLAWTSLEAVAGIIAGLMVGSIALIGFGADSVIEIASSAILLWRLSDHALGGPREPTALKLVGVQPDAASGRLSTKTRRRHC